MHHHKIEVKKLPAGWVGLVDSVVMTGFYQDRDSALRAAYAVCEFYYNRIKKEEAIFIA